MVCICARLSICDYVVCDIKQIQIFTNTDERQLALTVLYYVLLLFFLLLSFCCLFSPSQSFSRIGGLSLSHLPHPPYPHYTRLATLYLYTHWLCVISKSKYTHKKAKKKSKKDDDEKSSNSSKEVYVFFFLFTLTLYVEKKMANFVCCTFCPLIFFVNYC